MRPATGQAARRGLVALACGLLAWVLWVDYRYFVGGADRQEWWIVDAAETEPECRGHANAKLAEIAVPAEKGNVERPSLNVIVKRNGLAEGSVQVYRVLCLPDTIDPRGPRR
jgi:hypothetical protein